MGVHLMRSLAVAMVAGALGCAPAAAARHDEGKGGGKSASRAAGQPAEASTAAANPAIDSRAFMHGIGAARGADGTTHVFFSSSGLPPQGPDRNRNWTHDIYVADWTPDRPTLGTPRILIRQGEAQEPVSVAQTPDGRIMLTFEDGYNTANSVSQRFALYDPSLQAMQRKPADVWSGGHSGHVAAVGNRFVVFYSDDWVSGGGVDNLGTGKGVYLKTYDNNGKLLRSVDVARNAREWWPLVAGSDSRALLAWQEFVPGETHGRLKTAVYRPGDNTLLGPQVLNERLAYYTYSVAHVPDLDRFLVVGTTARGRGFAYLLNPDGGVAASLACLPASVREAGITVVGDMAYTPSRDGRLLHLKLSASGVGLQATQPSPIPWTIEGSLGLVRSPTSLHWVSLTREGLREADFDLRQAVPPSAADLCG